MPTFTFQSQIDDISTIYLNSVIKRLDDDRHENETIQRLSEQYRLLNNKPLDYAGQGLFQVNPYANL